MAVEVFISLCSWGGKAFWWWYLSCGRVSESSVAAVHSLLRGEIVGRQRVLQSHEVEGAAALPGQQPLTARNESAEPLSKHRMTDSCFEPNLINFFFSLLLMHKQMHQLAHTAIGNTMMTV